MDGTANSLWTPKQKRRTIVAAAVLALLLCVAVVLSRSENGNNVALSLVLGLSLGIVFERGRFCFYCIFRDSFRERSSAPLISIYAAIAVGSVGYSLILGAFNHYTPNILLH